MVKSHPNKQVVQNCEAEQRKQLEQKSLYLVIIDRLNIQSSAKLNIISKNGDGMICKIITQKVSVRPSESLLSNRRND